jgi:hypothetical protein
MCLQGTNMEDFILNFKNLMYSYPLNQISDLYDKL